MSTKVLQHLDFRGQADLLHVFMVQLTLKIETLFNLN